MTCAHRGSTASAPPRDARQDRHSAGGAASFFSPGPGSRFRPFPSWPGCPPLLRSLLRSRSDCCRARRASFAPIRSFELGVPESELSIDRRRSTSASRSSSRRSRSSDASSAAASAAICSSFAPITARSRETRSPCSPPAPDSSGTSRKHAQPELKAQPPPRIGVSRRAPVNGHEGRSCNRRPAQQDWPQADAPASKITIQRGT